MINGNIICTFDHKIAAGPYVSLNPGYYQLTFVIQLIEPGEHSEDILTLRAARNWGEEIWIEESFSKEDFDENGILKVGWRELISDNYNGVEFQVFPNQGTKVKVDEIYYQKLPR